MTIRSITAILASFVLEASLRCSRHRDHEHGASTAKAPQLISMSPQPPDATGSHHPGWAGDAVTEPRLIRCEKLPVPDGSRLGARPDPDDVERGHGQSPEHATTNQFHDASRPGWVSALPIF